MNCETKPHTSANTAYLYFLLIPYIYPRGYDNYYPAYQAFFTGWLYASIAVTIWILIAQLKNKAQIKNCLFYLLIYFGTMLIETLCIVGEVNEGLQKIFATPVLCILCMIYFRDKALDIIRVLANILIIENLLNVTVLCPPVMNYLLGRMAEENVMFVGHVQMASQMGVLGFCLAFFLHHTGQKARGNVLTLLSVATMFVSGAEASYACLALTGIVFLLYKLHFKLRLLQGNTKLLFNLLMIFNAVLIATVIVHHIDFGARYFVWIPALNLIKTHEIFGYGVYGVLIHTFWMDWTPGVKGMNYAHNEIVQLLLDGGIILLVAFLLMVNSILKYMKKVTDKSAKIWLNLFLIDFMMVATCDSISEYNYFYIFIIILAYMPEIQKHISDYNLEIKEKKNHTPSVYLRRQCYGQMKHVTNAEK